MRYLDMDSNHLLTDVGVLAVLKSCNKLSHVSLCGCNEVTDAVLHEIIAQDRCVSFLDVSQCGRISWETATDITKRGIVRELGIGFWLARETVVFEYPESAENIECGESGKLL